jgi:hypothetical protein
MNQPIEYFYIWVKNPNGMSWHGTKQVTRGRGEKLVAEYGERYPANQYWLELIEPPHAETMRERARELREAVDHANANKMTYFAYGYTPEDIKFAEPCAADLERYALQPVVFAEPPGECACKLPEESCVVCERRASQTYRDVIEEL